jgi:hypothetical protein
MKTLQTLSVTCWGIGLHEPRCTCNLGVKLAAQYRLAMKRMRANYSNFAPRVDSRRGDPRSMVPVRLAGAEVTEGFCTTAAGLS